MDSFDKEQKKLRKKEKKLRKKAKKLLKGLRKFDDLEVEGSVKPQNIVTYTSRTQVLVCLVEKELELVFEYFVGECSLNVDDFDRYVQTNDYFDVSAKLQVW
jgi:hypothetical protein